MNSTTLKNEQATIRAGATFARTLRGGDVVLLHGELGAGKTTFVKGIAQGLGVKETITSPTFALMGVYHIPTDEIPRLASLARDDKVGAAHREILKQVQDDKVGERQLCHIDTYRLKNVDELRAIGAEDYIGEPHTITMIEWPEKITALLRGKKTKDVFLAHIDGGRSITVQ